MLIVVLLPISTDVALIELALGIVGSCTVPLTEPPLKFELVELKLAFTFIVFLPSLL